MVIKNLTVCYGEKQILNGVNLSVNAGETVCVVGDSGAGKTTLLNAVAGLIGYGGEIIGAEKVSYVFQTPRLIGDLTVFKNVKFVAENKRDDEILSALKLAEIDHKENALAKTLSGGEKQRVSLARAIAYNAPVFLFDEPFSSLDTRLKKSLIEIVKSLAKTYNKSVIFVTHDISEIAVLADKVAILKSGTLTVTDISGDISETEKLNKIYAVLFGD